MLVNKGIARLKKELKQSSTGLFINTLKISMQIAPVTNAIRRYYNESGTAVRVSIYL